ncbi:MAG: hypothetical protein CMB31_06160 [Euryarchaeota archaeon]|nr:hypothetical protein [Euryarchaeota archaeon]
MIKQVSLVGGLMPLPKVCVTLSGNTLEEMLEDAALATAAGADLIEIRFDNLWLKKVEVIEEVQGDEQRKSKSKKWEYLPIPLENVNVDSCIAAFKTGITIPYIFTCRPRRQGGHFPGEESGRIAILESAIKSGSPFIDLEVDIDSDERMKLISLVDDSTKVIASEHGGSPPVVDEILSQIDQMSSMGSIVKICYRLTTKGGALRVLEAAKLVGEREDEGPEICIMGIGEGGDWSRIHAPILGSSLVYSTMEDSFDVIRQGRINFEDLLIAWDLLEYE